MYLYLILDTFRKYLLQPWIIVDFCELVRSESDILSPKRATSSRSLRWCRSASRTTSCTPSGRRASRGPSGKHSHFCGFLQRFAQYVNLKDFSQLCTLVACFHSEKYGHILHMYYEFSERKRAGKGLS